MPTQQAVTEFEMHPEGRHWCSSGRTTGGIGTDDFSFNTGLGNVDACFIAPEDGTPRRVLLNAKDQTEDSDPGFVRITIGTNAPTTFYAIGTAPARREPEPGF